MESNTDITTLSQTIMTTNGTSTTTSDDSFKFDDPVQRLFVAVTFIIVSIIGTIGNTLVITAVAVSRKLRTITNVFVVNLAVADLLTSLSVPWNAVALISRNGWPLHPYICTMAGAIMYLCIIASFYSLASVAINRFVLVTKQHHVYQKIFTKLNLIIWIILIWVVSFILVVFLPIIDVGGLGYNEKYSVCGQSSSHPKDDIYQLVQAMGSFPIPLIIICYSYIKIFLHVRNHMRVMNTHSIPLESNQTESTVAESVAQTTQEGNQQTTKPQKNGHSESTQKQQHEKLNPEQTGPGQGAIESNKETMLHSNSSQSSHSAECKDENEKATSQSSQNSSENNASAITSANGNANANANNSKGRVTIETRDSQTKCRLRRGRSSNRRQLQITKNMFVVVCAFFLCIAPFTLCLFFDDSDPFVPYASAIVLCNACINPVIYATKHPVFKAVMTAMVRCRFKDIPEPVRMVHRLTMNKANSR